MFIRRLQREIENAVIQCLAQAHRKFDPSQAPPSAQEQLAPLWQQGSELRQKLSAQATEYLCHVDPDQPFSAFFPPLAEHASLLQHPYPHSWPALELARMIQLTSSSSQYFEQQIMALLRSHPNGFGFDNLNDG